MIYEFKCQQHGVFTVNQPMLSNHESKCPECGEEAQRVFSVTEWIWKGELYRPDGSKRQDSDYAPVMGG